VVAASVRGVSATETTLMVAGEPTGQGISAATATLIAGALAVVGALLGVVVGLVVEYWLRRRGELRIQARTEWAMDPVPWARKLDIRFFNDRDVNISLWDPQVEFYQGAELLLTAPIERMILDEEGAPVELDPIDLESRKSVYLTEVGVFLEIEERAHVASADRVDFVATRIPGGRRVRKTLPFWPTPPDV
jgi:hypothetical protein